MEEEMMMVLLNRTYGKLTNYYYNK